MSLPINASARWRPALPPGRPDRSCRLMNPPGWLGAGPTRTLHTTAQESGRPGPKVLIVAGIHGDEPAGPAAAEQIRHWPIQKGSLLVVPRASVAALAAKTRLSPDGGTNRVNLNRVFPPRESPGGPAQELAAELWSLVKTQRPDWLLDLHEGGDFRGQPTNSVGSSVIAADMPGGRCRGQKDSGRRQCHRHGVQPRLCVPLAACERQPGPRGADRRAGRPGFDPGNHH
jgi:hypothetical protein